jgi:hypothetical protein
LRRYWFRDDIYRLHRIRRLKLLCFVGGIGMSGLQERDHRRAFEMEGGPV